MNWNTKTITPTKSEELLTWQCQDNYVKLFFVQRGLDVAFRWHETVNTTLITDMSRPFSRPGAQPGNFLLVKQRLKLIDFGIAKRRWTGRDSWPESHSIWRFQIWIWQKNLLNHIAKVWVYVYINMYVYIYIQNRNIQQGWFFSVCFYQIQGIPHTPDRIASNTTNISRESSVGTISYMAPEAPRVDIEKGRVKRHTVGGRNLGFTSWGW